MYFIKPRSPAKLLRSFASLYGQRIVPFEIPYFVTVYPSVLFVVVRRFVLVANVVRRIVVIVYVILGITVRLQGAVVYLLLRAE